MKLLFIFQKSAEKIRVSLKSAKNNLVLHMQANIHFWSQPASFFLDWGMFTQMLYRKSINTFYLQQMVFMKSCHLSDNIKKYCWARLATDDNVAHAHFMLDTQGYKHTLRICNSYCFSTATMVAHECASMLCYTHNITLHVLCLSY